MQVRNIVPSAENLSHRRSPGVTCKYTQLVDVIMHLPDERDEVIDALLILPMPDPKSCDDSSDSNSKAEQKEDQVRRLFVGKSDHHPTKDADANERGPEYQSCPVDHVLPTLSTIQGCLDSVRARD